MKLYIMDNAFNLVFIALMEKNPNKKCEKLRKIYGLSLENLSFKPIRTHKIAKPGRPNKPNLVSFEDIPRRNHSTLGMIKTIHAICHIEFNAINLALDAAYRFQNISDDFYQDWIKVAFEEAKHFNLLRNYLLELGYDYGSFDAHNGLWEMTINTDYDALVRMALVPRVLEARGLDVTPSIIQKFKHSKFTKMVDILQEIYDDEIGHVKIGNYWYKYLCDARGLDYIQTFDNLIKQHLGQKLRGPFNQIARLKAGFSEQELAFLQ